MPTHITRFCAGSTGPWLLERLETIAGAPLEPFDRLLVVEDKAPMPRDGCRWLLRGVASHERYVERAERAVLEARQPPLARREATQAALIPIRKSAGWWELPQDERRAIFEGRSAHIAMGVQYLPAVARRLYQCRDLIEPFDFLTWFEYAPAARSQFDELLGHLRRSEEWQYVEREVDIRLVAG